MDDRQNNAHRQRTRHGERISRLEQSMGDLHKDVEKLQESFDNLGAKIEKLGTAWAERQKPNWTTIIAFAGLLIAVVVGQAALVTDPIVERQERIRNRAESLAESHHVLDKQFASNARGDEERHEYLTTAIAEGREERHANERHINDMRSSIDFAKGVESERALRLAAMERAIAQTEINRANMHRHLLDEIGKYDELIQRFSNELGVMRERVASQRKE